MILHTTGGDFVLGPGNNEVRIRTKAGEVGATIVSAYEALDRGVFEFMMVEEAEEYGLELTENAILEPGTYIVLRVEGQT